MELQIQEPVFLIETEKISPNPFQPRKVFEEGALKELASSIREFGVLQPIVVTKLEKDTDIGTEISYQLVAGERRLMASKLVGLERIPAVIRKIDLDKDKLELAIIENVQRADLNPIETARAYSRLQDNFNLTQREIANRMGKSREVVANAIRLLGLPQNIQDAVSMGSISESQARLLLSVEDIPKQQMFFDDIVKNNVSVRELRGKITRMKAESSLFKNNDLIAEPVLMHRKDPQIMIVEKELEQYLGTRVEVVKTGESNGKITINFYSPEELQGIIRKLLEKQAGEAPSPLAGDFVV